MAEASYNPSMPFKWNAYRIQLLQPDQQLPQGMMPAMGGRGAVGGGGGGASLQPSSGNTRWPPSSGGGGGRERDRERERDRDRERDRNSRRSPPSIRRGGRSPSPRQRSPRKMSPPRGKATDTSTLLGKRERSRERDRDSHRRSRSPLLGGGSTTGAAATTNAKERTAAHQLSMSPPRRRQRIIPRYHCYLPKQVAPTGDLQYSQLHNRYPTLYIPSDFLRCEFSWTKSLQLDEPIQFSPHPITFHVLHKDVDNPSMIEGEGAAALENPPDADGRHVVKVLLLSHPGLSALRQKVFGLLPDGSIDENVEMQSIFKSLHMLTGLRGKNELICVGGAWSPSLDGDNPEDPTTQIRTVVRTTRALTGIDLSPCARWYKMLQLHYYRPERDRTDSVVLLMPDTSTCAQQLMPSAEAYTQLEERLREQLTQKLAAIDAEQLAVPGGGEEANNEGATAGVGAAAPATVEAGDSSEMNTSATESATGEGGDVSGGGVGAGKGKKTPWSQLNVKVMKVAELREELEGRQLDSKGVKNALVIRLQEALDKEKAEEGAAAGGASTATATVQEPTTTPAGVKEEAPPEDDEPEIIGEVNNSSVPPPTDELVEKKDDEAPTTATAATAKKSEKETKELERAMEKFERDKKERKAALERHYVLPKEPCLLVYPSRLAKGGKFECKVSSFGALLDYRLDDNKESSFEVFLLAEALKEALDRANGYAVYQAIASALDKEGERARRDAALNSVVESSGGGEEAKEEAPGQNGSDDVMVLEGPNASTEPATHMETDEKEKSTAPAAPTTVDPRSNHKALVSNAEMFCAFAHFDQNVCGHLEEHDLENILFSVGLDLSRGDVQRLAKKLSSRERINYRNLTDKWIDKDGNVKYVWTAPATTTEGETAPPPQDPSLGHHRLLLTDGKQKGEAQQPSLGTTPDISDTGVVIYKGRVLNIAQEYQQHKLIEQERTQALLKTEELDIQLKSTKETKEYLEKKKGRLEGDLSRYKKKLHETERSLKLSQESATELKTALQNCKRYGERVVDLVNKAIPPPPKKEKKEELPCDKKEKTAEPSAATDAKPPSEDTDNAATAATTGDVEMQEAGDINDPNQEDIVLAEEVGNGNEGEGEEEQAAVE